MAILDKSHFRSVVEARRIIEHIHRANPRSRYSDMRKKHIAKLREVCSFLLDLAKEPMFDDMQNLDTGGPVSMRKRLGASLYALHEELSDGYPDAG